MKKTLLMLQSKGGELLRDFSRAACPAENIEDFDLCVEAAMDFMGQLTTMLRSMASECVDIDGYIDGSLEAGSVRALMEFFATYSRDIEDDVYCEDEQGKITTLRQHYQGAFLLGRHAQRFIDSDDRLPAAVSMSLGLSMRHYNAITKRAVACVANEHLMRRLQRDREQSSRNEIT